MFSEFKKIFSETLNTCIISAVLEYSLLFYTVTNRKLLQKYPPEFHSLHIKQVLSQVFDWTIVYSALKNKAQFDYLHIKEINYLFCITISAFLSKIKVFFINVLYLLDFTELVKQ